MRNVDPVARFSSAITIIQGLPSVASEVVVFVFLLEEIMNKYKRVVFNNR